MKTFAEMEYHPAAESLVEVLCSKTQNSNPLFFRVLVHRTAIHYSSECWLATTLV